jgi:hypothetical protein
MLTAVAAVAIFLGAVAKVGLCTEAGTSSRRGLVLRVECLGGNTFISQHGVKPTYHPEAEHEHSIDLIFWVIFIVVFAVHGFSPRETVWPVVLFCWNMDKFEIEEEDGGNPLVYCCVGL